MSEKFFSLIHGDSVHLAPGTKVLPAEAFSSLVDAQGLLEAAKKDAEKYKEEVRKECEQLKEQAKKEGYEAGFKEWAEHIAKLQNEIDEVRKEFAKMLSPITLKAAKKIVGKELETSPDIIFDIVSNSLKAVLQHKRITIYVNKTDLDVLEKNRNKLKSLFENIEVLSIRERDDVKKGGCIIETEVGIINAQLDNQWDVLEKAFESLFKDSLLNGNKKTTASDKTEEIAST